MLAFTSGLQGVFSTEMLAYKCYVLPLVGQIKHSASDRRTILEMRFLFVKPSFAYFHFLRGENMPIGSCMGVVAAFRLLKPLYNFHKIWYERYSVSAETIILY